MSQPQEIKRPVEKASSAEPGISTEEEIRCRAFELYEQRGGAEGHVGNPVEDERDSGLKPNTIPL